MRGISSRNRVEVSLLFTVCYTTKTVRRRDFQDLLLFVVMKESHVSVLEKVERVSVSHHSQVTQKRNRNRLSQGFLEVEHVCDPQQEVAWKDISE